MDDRITLILFGLSQTGKSSFINTIAREVKCQVRTLGCGISCTTRSQAIIIQNPRSKLPIMLIDNQGLADSREDHLNDNLIKQGIINQMLKESINQILQFKPTKVVFALTESVSSDCQQFQRNAKYLIDLFGLQVCQSLILLITKYDPNAQRIDKKKQDQRLEEIKNTLLQFSVGKQVKPIPQVLFTTQIYTEQGILDIDCSCTDEELLLDQEIQLRQTIANVKSYPVQILNKYAQFCEKRIERLWNTDGIGAINYTSDQIQLTTEKSQFTKIFRLFNIPVWHETREEETPVTKVIQVPKQIKIKTREEIHELFMSSDEYREVRLNKLEQLFKKYVNQN